MQQVCEISKCSGCGACHSVCPHGAISMAPGLLGAMSPHIDNENCVDCGLCAKVCPVNNPVKLAEPSVAYAAYSISPDERMTSASGGAATILARKIIMDGGVVYGCAQLSGVDISHIRVDSLSGLERLKGSKYVQSRTAHVFEEVKNDLKENRKVLFIGTPCQVAGLKNYIALTKYDQGLIAVDLCCHGTPSLQILHDHLAYSGLVDADEVSFRDKSTGKIRYVFKAKTSDEACIYDKPAHADYYMTGFLNGMFLRESCFTCRYAASERCSDLTLADHWAMGDSEDAEMMVSKGLSTVLINTQKGKTLFESLEDLVYEVRPMSEAMNNGQFKRPVRKPEDYDAFAKYYKETGYKMACRKFLPPYQRRMILNTLKTRYYKWPLRQYIRKLLKR